MKVFLPFIALLATVLFGIDGLWTLDTNGRVLHTPAQSYDLGYNAQSVNYWLNVGTQIVPDDKQIDPFFITGTMAGATSAGHSAYLHGIHFDLTNSNQSGDVGSDPTRVRGIIGQVTTTGPGSVRGIHTHAIGNPGSTGAVNAANFQVSPASTTLRASAVQISNTGAPGVADGIFFGGAPNYARWGINMGEMSSFTDASIYLPMGENNAIKWTNGTRLYLDLDGLLKVKFPSGVVRILASP